jgi:hypothetical protein
LANSYLTGAFAGGGGFSAFFGSVLLSGGAGAAAAGAAGGSKVAGFVSNFVALGAIAFSAIYVCDA